MQKSFRKWAIGIVAFLLCFSLAINIHCVILLMKYRQIYQAPPVWVTEEGEDITSSNVHSTVTEPEATIVPTENISEQTEDKTSQAPQEKMQAEQPVVSVDDTVYITKSGTKFHRDGCSSLSKSRIAISHDDAVARGFTPCGKCAP